MPLDYLGGAMQVEADRYSDSMKISTGHPDRACTDKDAQYEHLGQGARRGQERGVDQDRFRRSRPALIHTIRDGQAGPNGRLYPSLATRLHRCGAVVVTSAPDFTCRQTYRSRVQINHPSRENRPLAFALAGYSNDRMSGHEHHATGRRHAGAADHLHGDDAAAHLQSDWRGSPAGDGPVPPPHTPVAAPIE